MKFLILCASLALPYALAGQDSSVLTNNKNTSSPFDLVITEIMADPDPSFGLPIAEYAEIYNRSLSPVNLDGWMIFEGSNKFLPDVELLPDEYLIICANSDTALFQSYGKVAGVSSFSLTNSGEKISIRNPSGMAIDSVTFSDGWYGSSYKKDGGWALERVDNNFTCHINANWIPSNIFMGGTPGATNSVKNIIHDTSPPLLLRAYCPDTMSVLLIFSEPLDPGSVTDILNYNIPYSGIPTGVGMADAYNTRILIILSSAIQPGQEKIIKVKNVKDCTGNKIADHTYARFGIPDTVSVESIIINEILFDPNDGGYDFAEFFHNGNQLVDISNYEFASLNLSTGIIENIINLSEEKYLFFPGEYMVVSEQPEIIATQYRTTYPYNFISLPELPSMNIDGGHVALIKHGLLQDEFRYDENFHFELLESAKGISLEKIHPNLNALDPFSWQSAAPSSGFATPGFRNSQYAEPGSSQQPVSVFPQIFSPDYDGKDDIVVFRIHSGEAGNISNITIYNSSGQVVFENNKNTLLAVQDAFIWDGINNAGIIASTGIYIAIVEIFNISGNVKHYKLPFVLATRL